MWGLYLQGKLIMKFTREQLAKRSLIITCECKRSRDTLLKNYFMNIKMIVYDSSLVVSTWVSQSLEQLQKFVRLTA